MQTKIGQMCLYLHHKEMIFFNLIHKAYLTNLKAKMTNTYQFTSLGVFPPLYSVPNCLNMTKSLHSHSFIAYDQNIIKTKFNGFTLIIDINFYVCL